MRKAIIQRLNKMNACKDAVAWAMDQPNKQAAWDACKRGDWMLWLLGRLSGKSESEKRKRLVLAACDCAASSLKYAGKNRKAATKAMRTARAWANGSATIQEVRVASAADVASAAASAADVASAAYAAAYAASSAADVASATYTSSAAYTASAAAANAAASYASRTKTLKQCANIVRKYYPVAPKF